MLHICIKYDMHRGVYYSQPSTKFWRYVAEQLDIIYVWPAGRSKEIRHIYNFKIKKLVLRIINLARITMC